MFLTKFDSFDTISRESEHNVCDIARTSRQHLNENTKEKDCY
jgi:hypothetical protein